MEKASGVPLSLVSSSSTVVAVETSREISDDALRAQKALFGNVREREKLSGGALQNLFVAEERVLLKISSSFLEISERELRCVARALQSRFDLSDCLRLLVECSDARSRDRCEWRCERERHSCAELAHPSG